MKSISFYQCVVIKDPKTAKRLQEEIKNNKSDCPDIKPSNTAKTNERFYELWGFAQSK